MIITNVWNDTPASSAGALSGNFTTNGGYVQIFFAGSAFSPSGGGMVGVNLLIDGNVVTSAKVYTNEQQSHKSLVPVSLVIKLAVGTHTVAIAWATPQTKLDSNDLLTLTVTELSFS
jgi:hypothetical protein